MPAALCHAAATEPDFAALQQAAEWFAILGDVNATEEDRHQWRDWLGQNAMHQAAWQRVEAVGRKFSSLPPQGKNSARVLLGATASRRAGIKALALLCTAGLGGWMAVCALPWQRLFASHHTGAGEQTAFALADGGKLWLNTASGVNVEYGAALRRIHLLEGEILLQTSADIATPPRSLVVDTRHGRMRALGTRFAVRQWNAFTDLTVFAGAVQAQPAAPGAASRTIHSGQQARFDADGIHAVEAAAPARQSWRDGLLLAEDMRLGDFIAELARYRRGNLGCDPAVAELRIVGTYRLGDTDAVLALLQKTLPVCVRHVLPWWVEVVPA